MAKLIGNVIGNYIDILLNTIPQMISDTTAVKKLSLYLVVAVLYPLALVVLIGLVAVAFVAVSAIHPFVTVDKNSPAP